MAGDEDRPSAEEPVVTTPDARPSITTSPQQGDPPAATGAADLDTGERPVEAFGAPAHGAAGPASRPRSKTPALLAAIGLILILLLVANLYTLYNPPENERIPALQAAVAGLHQQLAAVPKTDLAPLEGRLASLSTAFEALRSDVARGGAAEQAVAGVKEGLGRLGARQDDLDKRLGIVQGAVDAVPKLDLAPLEARTAELEKRLVPLEA